PPQAWRCRNLFLVLIALIVLDLDGSGDAGPSVIVLHGLDRDGGLDVAHTLDLAHLVVGDIQHLIQIAEQDNGQNVEAPGRGDDAVYGWNFSDLPGPLLHTCLLRLNTQKDKPGRTEIGSVGDGREADEVFLLQPLDAATNGAFGHAKFSGDAAVADP